MFTLKTFLTIYIKAGLDSYRNNMAGAKALLAWMGPLKFPVYEELEKETIEIPSILRNYEMQELAHIITKMYDLDSSIEYIQYWNKIYNTILICVIKDIMYRTNK